MEIKGGDRIPADIRLIFSQGCKVSSTLKSMGKGEKHALDIFITYKEFLYTQ